MDLYDDHDHDLPGGESPPPIDETAVSEPVKAVDTKVTFFTDEEAEEIKRHVNKALRLEKNPETSLIKLFVEKLGFKITYPKGENDFGVSKTIIFVKKNEEIRVLFNRKGFLSFEFNCPYDRLSELKYKTLEQLENTGKLLWHQQYKFPENHMVVGISNKES